MRNRDRRGELGPPRGGGEDEPDVEDELRALARWRTGGGDPEGLGPWPEAVAPDGTALPRLALRRKDLRARLGEGYSAVEVHRAVHGFAELVRAGVLAVENWRAPYCFAGFFDGLVVEVRRLEARRAAAQRKVAEHRAGAPGLNAGDGVTAEAMAAAYAESDSLQSLVVAPEVEVSSRRPVYRLTEEPADGELLAVRIRVHAVADMLEREPDDVLRALGRASMRAVEREDAGRIDRVFVALREGISVETIAGWWRTHPQVREHAPGRTQ